MVDEKDKKREFSEKQKTLLAALFGEAEGNWRNAMRLAGYSDATSISEAMEPIKEEVINQANSYLASLAPKAVRKMDKMLDDPNTPGAPNLMRVVESILNRVGLSEKKTGDDINLKVPSGGLFILPAKEMQEYKRVTIEQEPDDAEG
jgi:hypothetical protein